MKDHLKNECVRRPASPSKRSGDDDDDYPHIDDD